MPTEVQTPQPILIKPESEIFANLLRAAFNQVCDPTDWKNPIDAIVPWAAANIYMQAVEFMTGVRPNVKFVIRAGYDCGHITCIGYRAGPAGG